MNLDISADGLMAAGAAVAGPRDLPNFADGPQAQFLNRFDDDGFRDFQTAAHNPIRAAGTRAGTRIGAVAGSSIQLR